MKDGPQRSERQTERKLHQRQMRRSSVWFAGGAFAPILRRVDKFLKGTLAKDLTPKASRPSRTSVYD